MKQVLLKSFQAFLITVVLMFSIVSQPAIANELLYNSSVAPDKSYTKVDFGFNNCNVQWGELLSGVSEADMVKFATEANANGFTYHPSLNYGRIMVGDYPEGCKSPTNESWPLYLVAPDQSYTKVDFGFNNCNVQWGGLLSGVSEADMVKFATEANANGFTYHPSLNYGRIMVGDYPEGCKSPTNESWPLYLKNVSYKKMDFGFNKCNVQWGEVLSGVSEADMVKLATEANANGFTYHPSLNYGSIMVGDYPEGCKSPTNESWPLYLKI